MDVLLVQGIRQGAGDEIHLTDSSGHFSYPLSGDNSEQGGT